jgi:phage/plasmid-associated DNA primase
MGYRALMTVLTNMDVDQTAVHIAPKTNALADQKMETLDCVASWLYSSMVEGCIYGLDGSSDFEGSWPRDGKCKEVHEVYKTYAKEQGFRYTKDQKQFGKHIQAMLGDGIKRFRKNNTNYQGYFYRFEKLHKCRENFTKWFGHEVEW